MIEAKEIVRGLECSRFGRKAYTFETIDSTNNCARTLAECDAPEGALVFAEEQTAGKGRSGRTWVARPGENLTFSIVLRPAFPPEQINLFPLGVAVAVAEGIHRSTGLTVECKWPNDLMLAGRKCAGILMESALAGNGFAYIILGIGINVNQREFPEALRERATSLALHAGHDLDRTGILQGVLGSLERAYDTYTASGFQGVLPAWLARAQMIGARVAVDMQGSIVNGTVTGISPEGGLQLHTATGDLTLFAGDVTIVTMDPYAPRN